MRLLSLFAVCTAAALADDFPKPFNTGNDVGKKPMPASEAVKLIEMPPGFKATVFAAEPDVQNPIACAWDTRGRLWVAENYTYADAKTNFDKTLRDRILIFEDTDGDGVADKRTVFYDGLQNLTSIELGYGGVYATAAPRLVFIPRKDGEDKPSGEPVTLLDGFDAWGIRHNFVNGLKWGPDGWLYGRHGIQATSHVGAPGTPEKDRVALNCCIWRYHPVLKKFEVVCWGGTNSWGLDWTGEGEGFFVNTVIGHLYHLIPGAHYERMYGQDLNPYIYQLLPQTADHYHFDTSKGWTNSRDGKANDLGGGHAHSGCLIYQGDNWPESYRGKLYTLNFHGRRINCERLERQGSGYVAKRDLDPIKFGDPWFRGIELTSGPDGGVFVLDWSDDGECHESDGVHRESGRIYKITYGEAKKADLGPKGDLAAMNDEELVNSAMQAGEWQSRLACRVIAERRADPQLGEVIEHRLSAILNPHTAQDAQAAAALRERVAVDFRWKRMSAYFNMVRPPFGKEEQAARDRSADESLGHSIPVGPTSRLLGAETALKRPDSVRLDYLEKLLRYPEDVRDQLLPSFYWYVAEPVLASPDEALRTRAVDVVFHGQIPLVLEFSARKLAQLLPGSAANLDHLLALGAGAFDADRAGSILRGMSAGLRGVRQVAAPAHWAAFSEKAGQVASLAGSVRTLGAIFGDGRALDEIRKLVLDAKSDFSARQQALESLVAANPADLRQTLEAAVKDNDLLPSALAALARFDDAGPIIVENYRRVRADGKAAVVAALCSRPAFATALLEAVSAGKIPRSDVTPYHARQMAALHDDAVSKRLAEVWGTVGTTSAQKKARMAELRKELAPEALKKADLDKGRAVFTQTCAACHTLYDLGQNGANLGPNLTGSGRQDLNYLLESIVDPSALVPADYKLSVVTLKDGRVVSGFISAQNAQTMTVRTMTETQTLAQGDVAKVEASAQSLMPEGLLETLTAEQRRDLFGFLMRK